MRVVTAGTAGNQSALRPFPSSVESSCARVGGDEAMSTQSDSPVTRRELLGILEGEDPAAAAPDASQPAMKDLGNPLTKYPKPPFERQKQPWPGLACKMEPRPDHGEESYRGSNRLRGRKALVTGGDSGMGRAAAIAFAREGADAAINYFPTEEEDAAQVIALIEQEGRIGLALPGDIREEAFCIKL